MSNPGVPRVLIVAEHASAKFGGEAILPLHYFRRLRNRGIETWLIVHSRTQDELTAIFPDQIDRVYFNPDTLAHRLLYFLGKPLPARVEYFTVGMAMRVLTQIHARRLARRLVRELQIDVVHQPIPVSPKESSIMYGLGAPVVLGPLNGGMTYPAAFKSSEGHLVRLMIRAGRSISPLMNRLMPGKLHAETVLVANERTRLALPQELRGRVLELVENGVDLSLWKEGHNREEESGPTRFLFMGRLFDWKAVDLLIEAFLQVVNQTPATLDIIGSGPMQKELEAQARNLGLVDAVRFHGWMEQSEAAKRLQAADILVLPSLYECGGAVVLEAMATGIPVVATNWGGPADYLDSSCGILVDPSSPTEFVNALARAMTELSSSPERRRQMGNAGREKVIRAYDWEHKIDAILRIYSETIQRAELGPR